MKKRILAFLLMTGVILTMTMPVFAVVPVSETAKPTSSTVLVNGENVSFDAYNINGNNYFKLRDLAYTLSETEKQFEVYWCGECNAIILTSNKPYTADGGEMMSKGAGEKTATPTNSQIIMDGKEVQFTSYNIEGNNYFKLRDIGAAFDFGVNWHGESNTIYVDTTISYTPETPTTQPPTTQPPTTQPPVTTTLTEESVYNAMMAMQADYPHGMTWTNSNCYRSILFGGNGCGCYAFANLLSDAAFGDLPGVYHYNFNNIRVGDEVSYGPHTVIVLEVSGSSIVVAEGNYDSRIYWGRTIPISTVSDGFILTRWPGSDGTPIWE